MPKLWNETIKTHRREVREAILDTTWQLVDEHGLLSVTMSQIAKGTGIGRATLYKYFPNVQAILVAHHDRHVTGHLEHLAELRNRPGDPGQRLAAVLEAYALICYHREKHGTKELAALLHQGEQVVQAQRQVLDLIRDMLTAVAETGGLRDDVAPDELATYCLHALGAASTLPSEAAVRRIVAVTLAGLRPPLGDSSLGTTAENSSKLPGQDRRASKSRSSDHSVAGPRPTSQVDDAPRATRPLSLRGGTDSG